MSLSSWPLINSVADSPSRVVATKGLVRGDVLTAVLGQTSRSLLMTRLRLLRGCWLKMRMEEGVVGTKWLEVRSDGRRQGLLRTRSSTK
jgi:hypothetical protein